MQKFKSAPLPFQGQKRNFVKEYSEALKKFPADAIYVDLFGGSGLLSRVTKDVHPEARVIYNDFDNFSARLKAIPQTNLLLAKLRQITARVPRQSKIPTDIKKRIIEAVKTHENTFGYLDYITLSSSILFSGKYATSFKELSSATMYNTVRKSDITQAVGYLEGLEVVSKDYKEVYQQFKSDNTVYLLDPPYLSTNTATYGSDKYWKLKDYLDILELLEGSKYFYFTSNKSSIVELMEWFETTTLVSNPFKWSTTTTRENPVNYQHKYDDIMIYKQD
ncbi:MULTISPECIES: DNA adenine methylase [Leeuwenhoekiella]|uniref:DNA adenine methylase n=1 Tax=Leeuwenhoekiella TaxID=283735 RepID=UPI000C3D1504|nr:MULTISPECIES: DNA adenine methylase [Leeuwenhoekiella]MAO42169.1 DNA methyltransferase [Leeuwenhoekiella sp.]|tara:strand:- start:144 stop:974 length:831 start_codon:yes stop_codon:yes gene_type:complete